MMAWSSVDAPSELAQEEGSAANASAIPPSIPVVLGPEHSAHDVEEAEDVLATSRTREEEEEEEEDEEDVERYRASSVDDVCVSKADSSCPSSAGSFGLDPLSLGMRRSLSPRHHPLLSPMHMAKAGFVASPGRQVSPARSDAGVSSRAGCKRSVSSAINGKELLSLPPSHSLPVSPLSHRKFFSHRSPQRSLSHSRMSAVLPPHLHGSVGAVVTISGPEEDAGGGGEDSDEHRRRMRDILQNLPLAEIYKKRARRNNSRERQDSSRHASSSDAPPPSEATTSMEVLISTPSQETPPLSASSSGRHNFKKAMRDRYLLSQGHRGGGSSGGGSTSSQDSATSGGRLPLDLTSERFTKIREPLKSETEDLLVSPHLLLIDEINPHSPMDVLGSQPPPPAILFAQGTAAARSLFQQQQQRLLLSNASGSLGDDDPFYPSVPATSAAATASAHGPPVITSCATASAGTTGGPSLPAGLDPVQLIARTCRIESSSSSYLSVDMDSDPFSPMSPVSPCLVSPKHLAAAAAAAAAAGSGATVGPSPGGPGSGGGGGGGGGHSLHAVPTTGQHLQPSAAGTWMHPPPNLAPSAQHRSGQFPISPAMHPGAVPVPRQCQSAPQTPHSSPQIRPQFFFPPHGHMPPPPASSGILSPSPVPPTCQAGGGSEALCKIPSFESLPVTQRRSTSSAVSSPGLSPRGFESPQSDGKGAGEMSPGPGGSSARVTHGCPVCGRTFSRSDMLSRHMRLHTGLKPYECASCGQSFSRSDHLNTHIRTHTGEKPYHCPQCTYSACRRDMITRHMKVHRRKLAGPSPGSTGSPPPAMPSQPPGVSVPLGSDITVLTTQTAHSSADGHAPGPPEDRPP